MIMSLEYALKFDEVTYKVLTFNKGGNRKDKIFPCLVTDAAA